MSDKNHYVNNKEFTSVIREWRSRKAEAEQLGKPVPRIPEEAGRLIMLIAERYSMKHNFRGYYFRDEMISEAIIVGIKAFPNFDPDKYDNPLAYFTRCIHRSFIGTIMKEKKQLYARVRLIEEGQVDFMDIMENDDTIISSQKEYLESFLAKNEQDITFKAFEKSQEEKDANKHHEVGSVEVLPLDQFMEGV